MKISILIILLALIPDLYAQDGIHDEAYYFLSKHVRNIANSLDSFFGSKRVDEDFDTGTRIRTYWTFYKAEGQDIQTQPNIRVRLTLPNTGKRIKLLFENDSIGNDPNRKNGQVGYESGMYGSNNSNSIFTAAIRFFKLQGDKWNFNWDNGVKTQLPPVAFSRIRLRRSWQLPKEWEFRASQEIYKYTDIGFGETTRLELDHSLSESLLYRAYATGIWLDKSDQLTTTYGNVVLHQLKGDRGLSYNISTVFINRPVYHITDVDVSVSYRQNIYKNWLTAEVRPGFDFPKGLNWRLVPYIFFKLEMVIGETT